MHASFSWLITHTIHDPHVFQHTLINGYFITIRLMSTRYLYKFIFRIDKQWCQIFPHLGNITFWCHALIAWGLIHVPRKWRQWGHPNAIGNESRDWNFGNHRVFMNKVFTGCNCVKWNVCMYTYVMDDECGRVTIQLDARRARVYLLLQTSE